ncbi:MAG: PolC-type DNA polymerase III [Clostridia bacterium]|nr:PolC-type DNA polymerase III [Clostridia bacterium]
MSEVWTQLMKNVDNGLTQSLTLERVTVSRATGGLRAFFLSSRILTEREIKTVERAMRAGFPDQKMDVSVRYPALREDAIRDIDGYKAVILRKITKESPGSMPYLTWNAGQWRFDENRIKIAVSAKEGVDFLRLRGVDKMIEKEIKDLFDIEAPIVFETVGDEQERISRIAEKRREEEARLAQAVIESAQTSTVEVDNTPTGVIRGQEFTDPIISMRELTEDAGKVALMGEVVNMEMRDTRNTNTKILTFTMTDYEGSVTCKAFLQPKRGKTGVSLEKQIEGAREFIKEGKWLKVRGEYKNDDYSHVFTLFADDIVTASKPVRKDKATEKRVELHLHTQMSAMDACASPTDLIKQAAAWGHTAIAITDHGVVQAYPEAFGAAKKAGIKLIPGCEGYLIEDCPEIVQYADDRHVKDATYVVLDVETTGLNTAKDKITEIGAVKIKNGVEVEEYSMLINPECLIPEKVTEITGINAAMLRDQPTIEQVIHGFAAFCEGSVLVAHNASFDMAFFRRAFRDAGIPFHFPILDTLALSRNYYRQLKSHKLGQICKALGISLTNAHRAVHDARATGEVLVKTLESMQADKPFTRLSDLNSYFQTDAGGESRHIILLATSREGMTNLNRMVSEAHLKYFHRTPRMPRSLIQKNRKDILVGSACEAGELYRAVLAGKSEKELDEIASFYDYLEIQPLGNNEFMIREGLVPDEEALKDINRHIVEIGRRLNKPVVATGDVHFKDPKDAIYRAILMATKGFEDADQQAPLYFRTTDDMLREFEYLGKEEAYNVVIKAPNEIADHVEHIKDLFMKAPDGGDTFQPLWEDAEQNLRDMCEKKARDIFGDPLPDLVRKRLDKELGSICGYGFSTLYMIAVKLVAKSLSDGYIVGSRGSVGSSFVAKLAGITEVDALPPYYACPKCKHYEFDVPKEYTCGLDLPPKNCPECGTLMIKDGFNIPFEVFLGFKGDKVPDIDLNFSGVYQPRAHQYVKDLFGEENVFRAGTMGTVAEKTAYGYVLKYEEERGLNSPRAERERLARGITGVKRTTGQHPAGMVVLPKGYEIYQFTAIQHPADDVTSETITTHYDFTSMHDVLVKLDILGHDDPTMLRNLQDLTGIKPQDVPLNDPDVFKSIISLFSSPKALGLTEEELGVPTGTLGIPEFGTKFVRGMLVDTRPSSMEELIRISGLSHGTAVWLGNIQDILKAGLTDLKHAICTRDDIMNQLMDYGVEPKMAFTIMEFVRKGKGAIAKGGDLKPDMLEAMEAVNTPDWFIGACRKIEYMFPKAHAVAYVTMALRIAYFKVFYPGAYYACFLFRNAEDFNGATMVCSVSQLKSRMTEIEEMEKEERERHDGEYSLLESMIEMNLRGIKVLPVDLYKSDAEKFLLVDDTHILPPLSSLPGLGLNAAINLTKIREEGRFISREDMVRRKVGKAVVETLANAGCLNDLPETSQVSLFEFAF